MTNLRMSPRFWLYFVRVRFIQIKMEQKIKDLENYLNDLDNLIDTGWFPKDSVKESTFYHKDLTLSDFVSKGREYIRQYLMIEKGVF